MSPYKRGVRSRKRQAGAETVESVITLLLFFLVFFLIVDMSVVVYNQGVTNLAAREGARQGSLYWVDPSAYDKLDPIGNIRMKEEMITTAIDYVVGNILIKTGTVTLGDMLTNPSDSSDRYPKLPGALETNGSFLSRRWTGVSDATVIVRLWYPHDFMVLSNLLRLGGITLGASAGLRTEADL